MIATSQKKLDYYVIKSDVTKAEIIQLLKTVDSGFSVHSNDDINDLSAAMFSDSAIASQIKMARSKSIYKVNHGLALHFKSLQMTL